MDLFEIAKNTVPFPKNITKLNYENGNTDDIIKILLATHVQSVPTVSNFAKFLKGKTLKQTLYNVWHFARKNIRYQLDPYNEQFLKTANRTIYDGFGDCKSLSLLIGSILTNLGINADYRFVSYSNTDPRQTHVYVISNGYVLDACLKNFNEEKKFASKLDKNMTKISQLSGPYDNNSDISGYYEENNIDGVGRRKKVPGKKGRFLNTLKYVLPQTILAEKLATSKEAPKFLKNTVRKYKNADLNIGNPETVTEGELALRIARQKMVLEHDRVAAIGGPGRLRKCERYKNRLDVINDALSAIAGPDPETEIGFIIDDIQAGVYNIDEETSSIGSSEDRDAIRGKKKEKRKEKREAKMKAGKKPLFKKLKSKAQVFLKKVGTGVKKGIKAFGKLVTAPMRLAAKGILEVMLPKISPFFLYTFITDPKIIAKLPPKVLRKRKKAEKFKKFIVNVIGMKEPHFNGIIRNGITKKYGQSPESYLANQLAKIKTSVNGIGCCACQKIENSVGFVKDAAELAKGIIELLNKIISVFKKKASGDEAPTEGDIPDPVDDFTVETETGEVKPVPGLTEITSEVRTQPEQFKENITNFPVITESGMVDTNSSGTSSEGQDMKNNTVPTPGTKEKESDDAGDVYPEGGKKSGGFS